MSSAINKLFSGSIWGIFAKVLDALAKFLSIPMLVGLYGESDYGLIVLAFSLNAYLRLMDMGTNVGSIRFYSIWIAKKEWSLIGRVSQTGIVFYGVIGIVNAIVFLLIGRHSQFFFNIKSHQIEIFQNMMFVLAASTIINWLSNVVIQLLTAYGEISWLNKISIISSVLNLLIAVIAIKAGLDLNIYFLLFTISALVVVPINIYRLRVFNLPLLSMLLPKWYWSDFKATLMYSLGMFVMAVFQFSADNLRPLLLSRFSDEGVDVLTKYRVIQTISTLVIAFAGVFLQGLLPYSSKAYSENDSQTIKKLAYEGTKYISLFLSFVIFILISNSSIILNIYMGEAYEGLSIWLNVWLLSLLGLHTATIASLILSSGKIRPLIFMSGFSCIVSLSITVVFAPQLNLGSAVIGYSAYVLLQLLFFYLFYIPRVLKLQSNRIFFSSFIPSLAVGMVSYCFVYLLNPFFLTSIPFVNLCINSFLFVIAFVVLMLLFVIKPEEFMNIKKIVMGK